MCIDRRYVTHIYSVAGRTENRSTQRMQKPPPKPSKPSSLGDSCPKLRPIIRLQGKRWTNYKNTLITKTVTLFNSTALQCRLLWHQMHYILLINIYNICVLKKLELKNELVVKLAKKSKETSINQTILRFSVLTLSFNLSRSNLFGD